VPGLIPGASTGKGLGLEFLRHVERCSVLVHVLDTATLEPHRDPLSDLDTIEAELAAYGGLDDRPRLVVLNKIDVPDGRDLADIVRPELEARGLESLEVSAATHEGLRPLVLRLASLVEEYRDGQSLAAAPRIVLRPKAVNESTFTVVETGEQQYLVTGTKPERWVRQTAFDNDEAVGYLGDRLAKLGVEAELAKMGAKSGAEVTVGAGPDGVTFDWEPTLGEAAAIEALAGPRGTDKRVADSLRLTRAERDARYAARRDGSGLTDEEISAEEKAFAAASGANAGLDVELVDEYGNRG
jgi:GTP-binding protein